MVHAVAKLGVQIIKLALKLKVILFYLRSLGIETLQLSRSFSVRRAVGLHGDLGDADLLGLRVDPARKRHHLAAQCLDTSLGGLLEHGLGLNILLRFADTDIQLGQLASDLVAAQNDLTALRTLFVAEFGQLRDTVRKVLFLRRQGLEVFLVSCARFLVLLHVCLELLQKCVVGFELCAKLLKLTVFGVAKHLYQLAAILCRIFLVFQIFQHLLRFGNGCRQRLDRTLALGKLGFQTLDLARAGKNSATRANRSTRKRTAHVDLLTVERDGTDAIMERLCHDGGVVDVIEYNGSAEKRRQNACEFLVGFDELIGNADISRKACGIAHLLGRRRGLHRGQREEGRASRLSALKGKHCRLGGCLVLNDDVLKICTECDLDGSDVAILNRDHLGKRTVDRTRGRTVRVGDRALVVFFHHETDGVGVALKMLVHRFKGCNSLRDRITAQILGVESCGRLFYGFLCRLKLFLRLCDLGIDARDLGFVPCHRAFLGLALRAKRLGNAAVLRQLVQRRAVFIGIGVFGIFKHRHTNLHVHRLVLKRANIVERLRNGHFQCALALTQLCLLLGQGGLLCGQGFLGVLQFGDLSCVCGAGIDLGIDRLFGAAHTSLGCGDQILCVRDGIFRHAVLALKLVAKVGLLADLREQRLRRLLASLRRLKQPLVLRFQRLDRVLGGIHVEGCMLHRFLGGCQLAAQLFGIVEPKTDVGSLFVVHQLDGFFCFFGFLAKRLYARRDLGKDIVYARHIILGVLELALRLVLFVAVLGNSRRVLKHTAAFLALTRHHFGNSPLTDDRVTVTTDTRVHEQLVDVLETNTLAVDKIFTVTRAVVTACDRYLVVGAIQLCKLAAIIKGDRYLGVSHGTAAVSSSKDDVLHLRAAKALGRDLTQNPTHRVGNIGFSRAVRTNDNGHALCRSVGCLLSHDVHRRVVFKHELGLIGKGLKALHFQ